MSSFFERNKKKSILAALLLLLKRGKGGIALFVLVALLAGVFVLPGGMRVPWASKDGKPGFDNQSDARRMADMAAAIKTARDSKSELGLFKALWGARAASQASTWQQQGKSTVDFVKGKLPEFDEQGGSASSGAWDGKVGRSASVAGIANPADGKSDNSVTLERGDFLGGLVRSADAGVIASGGPMADPGIGSDPGKLADPGKMAALEKGSAVNIGDGIKEQALKFDDVPKVPGQQVNLPKGEKYDKLDANTAKNLAFKSYGPNKTDTNLFQPPVASGKPTFFKLAEARAYSVTAAPPTCQEPACPKEYAHTMSAIVFDGQKHGMGIMGSAELGENTSPIVPDQTKIGEIVDETMKYYNDTKECEAAELWANPSAGALAAASPDAKKYYDEKMIARYQDVKTFSRGKAAEGGRSVEDEVAQAGGTERELMRRMQLLSCAMGCKPQVDECVGWESMPCGSNPPCNVCLQGACDSGSCDKEKAKRCKAVGNRMRDVCFALKAIWTAKHQGCPLAYGTDANSLGDYHECNQ